MPLKVAMWALGILVLSLFGVVIINLFGNITVTDQLNYTTMKNAVEASMYDALDVAHYRTGFCLCTNVAKTSGKWSFNDDSEYELLDITYENDKEKCVSTKTNCEILYGEYRINGKVFTESLVRRFAEMVNNNKDYELVIQDIIEYPPKVSVRINSKDTEFSRTEKNSGGYTIVNQMDAIIETKTSSKATPIPNNATPKPTATPSPTPTPTNTPKPTATPSPKKYCYTKADPSGDPDLDLYEMKTDAEVKKLNDKIAEGGIKWVKVKGVTKSADCHCKADGWKLIERIGGKNTYSYCDGQGGIKNTNCSNGKYTYGLICSRSISRTADGKYYCGKYKYTCTKPTTGSGDCMWKFSGSATCNGTKFSVSGGGYATCAGALKYCELRLAEQCSAGSLKNKSCTGYRTREWQVVGETGTHTGKDNCSLSNSSISYACQGKSGLVYCKCK